MLEHARFTIQCHEPSGEAFFGDIFVLLLVFEDLFDQFEAFSPTKAANRVFINASSSAEPFELGGLLELLDEAFEAAFFVEIFGNGFDVSCCGVWLERGGERAA